MENYFLEKYKTKSKYELQKIIDAKGFYQPEAVDAATKLLSEWKEEPIVPQKHSEKESIGEDEANTSSISKSFNYKPFFRTLSYRDFLTNIALALLYVAFIEIVNYYSGERLIENFGQTIKIIFVILLFIVNHVYYRIEHGRSNNFIGRSMNDIMLFISITILLSLYGLLLDNGYGVTFFMNDLGLFILITWTVLFTFLFESCVAFLKLILKKLKCQIF